MILSKIDLLPYVDFDPDKAIERARRLNPELEALRLSVRSGDGMSDWLDWIAAGVAPEITPGIAQEGQ